MPPSLPLPAASGSSSEEGQAPSTFPFLRERDEMGPHTSHYETFRGSGGPPRTCAGRRPPPSALPAAWPVCRDCVHEPGCSPSFFRGRAPPPGESGVPSTCHCPAVCPGASLLAVSSWARGQVGFCGSRASLRLLTAPAGRPGSLSHGVSRLLFLPFGVLWVSLGDLMGPRQPAEPCGPQAPDP